MKNKEYHLISNMIDKVTKESSCNCHQKLMFELISLDESYKRRRITKLKKEKEKIENELIRLGDINE